MPQAVSALMIIAFAGLVFMIINTTPSGSSTTQSAEKAGGLSEYGAVTTNKKLKAGSAPKEFMKTETGGAAATKMPKGGVSTNLDASASSGVSDSTTPDFNADLGSRPAKVSLPATAGTLPQKGELVVDSIKQATKGDGLKRDVILNTNTVVPELVELAMFENRDFMPHLEAKPAKPLPHLADTEMKPQRSMFRKMTFPLVWQGGDLGMDVIGEKDDTRATIAAAGGRYK